MLIFGSTYDTEGTGSAVAGDDAAGFQPGEVSKALCFDGGFCGCFYFGVHVGGVDQIDVGFVRILLLHKIPD